MNWLAFIVTNGCACTWCANVHCMLICGLLHPLPYHKPNKFAHVHRCSTFYNNYLSNNHMASSCKFNSNIPFWLMVGQCILNTTILQTMSVQCIWIQFNSIWTKLNWISIPIHFKLHAMSFNILFKWNLFFTKKFIFIFIIWSSLVVWTNMEPKYRKNIMHYYYHELLYCSIPKNILINYQTFIWKHSSIFLTSIESFNYLSTYTIIQIWKKNGVILFYSTTNKSCHFCKIIFLKKKHWYDILKNMMDRTQLCYASHKAIWCLVPTIHALAISLGQNMWWI
jgi:hypothetical protein